MGEFAFVKELKGKDAIVIMERSEACKKCRACANGLQSNEMILQVENICKAKEGDEVEIMLESSNFLKAVAIMYGIPLIALFVGIFIGYALSYLLNIENYKEITAFIFGVIVMGISYLFIKSNESKFKSQKFKPTAIKIIRR